MCFVESGLCSSSHSNVLFRNNDSHAMAYKHDFVRLIVVAIWYDDEACSLVSEIYASNATYFIEAKKNLETIVNLIAASYDWPSGKDLFTWYSFNLRLKWIVLIFNIHSIYILPSCYILNHGCFSMLSNPNNKTSENTSTLQCVLKLSIYVHREWSPCLYAFCCNNIDYTLPSLP